MGEEEKNGGARTKEPKAAKATDLVAEARAAYGIAPEFIIGSAVRDEDGVKTAVIVTAGGKKVSYTAGQKMEKLEPVEIDGVVRKKMKAVTGGKK